MRESIIQTTINKFLTWLAKKSVTALYKRTHFWTFSWGLDENTDLYLMSEESYHDYHRFGVREEKYADTPQTESHITCYGTCTDKCGAYENGDCVLNARKADTPQTDKDKVVCPNCGRSDYIRNFEKDFGIKNSEYRYKCINCNTYIKDTPQTESTGSPIGDYRDGVGAWQTDCGWGKPTTVSHREEKED